LEPAVEAIGPVAALDPVVEEMGPVGMQLCLPLHCHCPQHCDQVISPDLIPRRFAYRAFIQILVILAMIQDAVIRTCMYLLDF
jgi:hypothetical protein